MIVLVEVISVRVACRDAIHCVISEDIARENRCGKIEIRCAFMTKIPPRQTMTFQFWRRPKRQVRFSGGRISLLIGQRVVVDWLNQLSIGAT